VEWRSGTARRGDGTAAAAAVACVRRRGGSGRGSGGGGFGESLPGRRSSSPAASGSSAMAHLESSLAEIFNCIVCVLGGMGEDVALDSALLLASRGNTATRAVPSGPGVFPGRRGSLVGGRHSFDGSC